MHPSGKNPRAARLVMALSIALLIVGVGLFWVTRSDDRKMRLDSNEPGTTEPGTRNQEWAKPEPKPEPVPEPVPEPEQEPPEPVDSEQAILKAASECYRGEPVSDKRMEVRYELVIEKGRASLQNVTRQSSDIDLPLLENCVVSTLEKLTWNDPAAIDKRTELTTTLSVNDLARRSDKNPKDGFKN
jgi:hypothetical protein